MGDCSYTKIKIWWILFLTAVVTSDSEVTTMEQVALSPVTVDVIEPYRPSPSTNGPMPFRTWEAKLSTGYLCVPCIPVVITHCSPLSVKVQLYSPLPVAPASPEANSAIAPRNSFTYCAQIHGTIRLEPFENNPFAFGSFEEQISAKYHIKFLAKFFPLYIEVNCKAEKKTLLTFDFALRKRNQRKISKQYMNIRRCRQYFFLLIAYCNLNVYSSIIRY